MAQQVATSESFSANPAAIQKAAISSPYLSRSVELAPDIKPIFVVRDTNTGESVRQFPTEAQIRAYQRATESKMNARAEAQAQAQAAQIGGNDADQAAALVESSIQYREVRQKIKQPDAAPAPLPGQSKVEVKSSFEGKVSLPGGGGAGRTGTAFSADV